MAVVGTDHGSARQITIPGGATGVDFTLTGGSPAAGEMVAVIINCDDTSGNTITCQDDVGGTTGWVSVARYLATGGGVMWLCYNLSIPASVTKLTIKNAFVETIDITVGSFTNVSGRNAGGDDAGSSSGSTALTGTTTSACNSGDLLILFLNPESTPLTSYTAGSGETMLAHGATWTTTMAYVVAPSANFAWTAIWTPLNAWGMKAYAFTVSGGGGGVAHRLLTLGVG